jgi:hypothetical protein
MRKILPAWSRTAMTTSSFIGSVCRGRHPGLRWLLGGVLVLAPLGVARAWQMTAPAASVQFRQTVSQQQVRDQLQKSQLEQQLRQSVADTAKRPHADDPRLLQQLEQADRAQRDRERARQQGLIDSYVPIPAGTPPRMTPKQSQPAVSRSGG